MAKKKAEKKEEVDVTKEMDSSKLSKLLINELNKNSEVGKVAWCLATDSDNPTEVKEFISTGSTVLDYIISNRRDGGVPVGKLTEISGEEASGKSLVCAHLIAETQRRGGLAIYIDTENAANPSFMQQIGVDISKLVYLQPGTIEEVGEAIEKTMIMARTKAPDKLILIIWDSVAGTPPQAEIEGDFDPNSRIGLAAKAIAKMMRKLTQAWGKERIAMVFTNQLKVKIGVMFGDPMMTPGGKAIPYHASVRVRLTRSANQKDGEGVWGVRTLAQVVKSRLGPPLRKCEFMISFATGIEDEPSIYVRLHEAGQILKKGGFIYLSYFPSGDIESDGVDKGKDLGVKLREGKFTELLRERPDIKAATLDVLEKAMVIKYGEVPSDRVIDPDSLMDNEAVTEAVLNGEI